MPRGFDHLLDGAAQGPRARLGRTAALGLLVGGVLAGAWGLQERRDLELLQARQARVQAELAQWQAAQGGPEPRAQADAHMARLQADRQQWLRGVAVLEGLTAARGARLSQLRLDAQGLHLQGQLAAAPLEGWVAALPAGSWGLGHPQLLQFTAPAPGGAGPGAQFALRWPLQLREGAP